MPKRKRVPQRTCVGCGAVKDKRDLVRIVRTPEGEVLVDSTGKRSGRGAYVCPDPECLSKAARGGKLSKALEAEIPDGVVASLVKSFSD